MKPLVSGWILALLIFSPGAVSPAQSDATPSRKGVEFFEQHIRPLLAKHCYECHSARKQKREGGLLLDSQSGWEVGGENGPALVPGDVDASLLIRAVRYTDDDIQMPPNRALPAEAVARLEQWVRMGAPDPRTNDSAESDETFADPSDPIAGRDHWAFQPLSIPQPPTVEDAEWPRRSLDRFVLARLEAEKLQPAPDANPRDLVRRLYFQLIGLPPTPQQIEAFLHDPRPDAVEHLVDELLDSPRYGERWGRHWLDLARFADSNGLDENFLFREAWRYRNWVIDAVNNDMPYDRFLLEQIAGDLLPYDSVEQRDRQRMGTGFMVVGPKVLLGNDERRQRMEVADEQIDTIGRAILGQTLGCCRCHDHKFDPFPTKDYYALAGILTSTTVMERRHMLNQQRVMERLVGIGSDGEARDGAYEKFWREFPEAKEKADQAKSAWESLKKGDEKAVATLLEKNKDAVAEIAADSSKPMQQRITAQKSLAEKLAAVIANRPPIPPRAMIATDAEDPADEAVRISGEFDDLGDQVSRGFLQVLTHDQVEIPEDQSGRLQLSRWLTDVEHGAGHLAARVLANRIWHHLIGRGIVRTVDNFGRAGEVPSHPELLDYLASELINSGWSIKSLVREIAISRTNLMSSAHNETAYSVDPENRLLWKFNRRRLDPESLRDAMLAAGGLLDLAPMESTVWNLNDQATGVGKHPRRRTDFPCRSVYLPVIRNDLPELFEVFDFANPQATTGGRPETTVAIQGLYLLNAEMVMDAAEATARRILDRAPEKRFDLLFSLILNSEPTSAEREELESFVQQTRDRLQDDGDEKAEIHAWTMTCHALFASSRFQFLE